MKSGWVLRPGSAEFPHGNALIGRGTLWIGTALCGAETVDAPAVESESQKVAPRPKSKKAPPLPAVVAAPIPEDPVKAVTEPIAVAPNPETPVQAVTDAAPDEGAADIDGGSAATDAAQDQRVEHFVRAIAEVALAHGAAETAAHVESLFKFGTPAPLALSDLARAALFDGNILEDSDGGIHATAWFARTSSAWQRMLRGEAENLAVCGDSTLDGWTADLIARLVAKPSMASAIRRDLRRRGIAAFGMLD